jgi:hypothetical protein
MQVQIVEMFNEEFFEIKGQGHDVVCVRHIEIEEF